MALNSYMVVFSDGHVHHLTGMKDEAVVESILNAATHFNARVSYIRNQTTNQIIYGPDPVTVPGNGIPVPKHTFAFDPPAELPNVPGNNNYTRAMFGPNYKYPPDLGPMQRPQCDHDWKELHLFTSSEISCTKCGIKK